jgi:hypothetical protein
MLIKDYGIFIVGKFEDEIANLKNKYYNDCYEYPDPSDPSKTFRECTTQHFKKLWGKKKYGIYIVRQKDTRKVLYIGMGGKLKNDGQFKKQDIPNRLRAKRGKIPANKWFSELKKVRGNLLIEYIILPDTGFPSPALIEAILLQVYLNEYGYLPYKNKEF